MATVDAVRTQNGAGRKRAVISRDRVKRAAREAMKQAEAALAEGDSRKARELTGVMREMMQLLRELQGGESQSVTVCFIGDTEEAAR